MLKCPICDFKIKEESFLEKFKSLFNNQEYKLYHCLYCDLDWWEPLKMVPEIYEKEIFEGYKERHLFLKQKIKANHKLFFKKMPLKSGRLLDAGCAEGTFLNEAKKRGYDVWGIDIDRKSIEVCHNKFKLNNTFSMNLSEFSKFCREHKIKFDIITFFEVLEHQDNPQEFLKNIKNLLKKRGWIAGSVPNKNSFFNKHKRKYEFSDFPPHHFLRFSKKSLKNLFNFSFKNGIFNVSLDFNSFISLIEIILLGKTYPEKIYNFRKKLVNDDALLKYLTIDDLFNSNKIKKNIYYPLKFLKIIHHIIFYPIAFIVFLILKSMGDKFYFQFYFQAQK